MPSSFLEEFINLVDLSIYTKKCPIQWSKGKVYIYYISAGLVVIHLHDFNLQGGAQQNI